MKKLFFKNIVGFLILLGICLSISKPSWAKEIKHLLGEFNISAYSPESNDPIGTRETSTGAVATANKTIAIDMHNPIANYGDILEINGQRYVVEDCGNLEKYNRQLDIFMDTGSEADKWGVRTREVFLIKEVDEDYFEVPESTIEAMKKAYEDFLKTDTETINLTRGVKYGTQNYRYM